jgi:tRNA 2-thiouridine synthesizing protein A
LEYFLDITHLLCPMTFVRTKLAVERLSPGDVLEVRLNPGEPLENVPKSLRELGHEVLQICSEDETVPTGPYRMRVQYCG